MNVHPVTLPDQSLLFFTASTPGDVKKLKVCIELSGLRLSRPLLPEDIVRSQQPSRERLAESATDILPVRGRSEVSRGFGIRDRPRGKDKYPYHVNKMTCDFSGFSYNMTNTSLNNT